MGRPSIATSAPGCREVVVHAVTGYLVPPKDIEALAAAMIQFLDRPDRIAQMGAAARRRIVDTYDEGLVLRETLREYQRLLGHETADDKQTTVA